MTNQELIQEAAVIRDERNQYANTAERVGTALVHMAEQIAAQGADVDKIEADVKGALTLAQLDNPLGFTTNVQWAQGLNEDKTYTFRLVDTSGRCIGHVWLLNDADYDSSRAARFLEMVMCCASIDAKTGALTTDARWGSPRLYYRTYCTPLSGGTPDGGLPSGIFKWSAWQEYRDYVAKPIKDALAALQDTLNSIDDEPTLNSKNLVKSGGVARKIAKLDYSGNIFEWENLPKDNNYILYSTGNPASAAIGMYRHINKIFYVTAGTCIEYKIYGQGGADIALIAVYDKNGTYQQGQSVRTSSSNGFVEGALNIHQDGYIKISFNESTLGGGVPEGSYVYFDAYYIKQDKILKSELTGRIDSDMDNITLSESDLYDVYANVGTTNARISDASIGTITADASWRLTDYMSLKDKPVSKILFSCYDESNVHIAYYNENKQYIGCYPIPSTIGAGSNRVIPIFNIPSNAYYFRYNYATWEKKGCVVYYKNPKSISEDNILDMPKCFEADTVIQKGFLQSNGVNTGMTTYRTTVWIKVPHNYTIVVNGYDELGYPLAIYSYRFTDVCAWGELTTPSGSCVISLTASDSDMYFICQLGGQYQDTGNVKYGVPEIRLYKGAPYTGVHNRNLSRKVHFNQFAYKDGIKALINNVLCIGDSITEGVLATGVIGNRLPYPTVLAQITSWNVTNAGLASRTAVSWVNEKLNAYNYANYDTFIIYFGTNDTALNTLSGDFDGDTDYSSADDYAATTEGQYARLVETILTCNPSAKIFLLRGGQSCRYMHTCIEKLKEKYNAKIIDIDDADDAVLLRDPRYHSVKDMVHYNQLGYCVFASKVFDLLAKSLVK